MYVYSDRAQEVRPWNSNACATAELANNDWIKLYRNSMGPLDHKVSSRIPLKRKIQKFVVSA